MAAIVNNDVLALQLEKVRDKLPLMYERDNVFFAKVKSKGDKVSSRNMRIPLQLRPGGRPGLYSPDGGAMGRGTGTKYDVAQVTPVHLKFAVEINKLVELATNSDEKAIEDAVKKETKNAMAQFRAFIDKLSQQSNTGQLGTISAGAGTTTWTLAASNFNVDSRFHVGQGLTVFNSALTATRAGTPIVQQIIEGSSQIVIDVDPTTSANDVICIEGSTASAGSITSTALFGIPYHQNNANSGTWLSLNRANYPEVYTPTVNASSGSLAWSYIRQAVNKIRIALGADAASGLTAYMHLSQAHAYEDLLLSVTNIEKSGRKSVDLGFDDVETMAGVPVLLSINADKTRIDFLSFESWGRAIMQDVDYYTPPGSDQKIFFPVDSTTGSPVAAALYYLTTSFQFFVDNPRRGSYISSLAVPSGY